MTQTATETMLRAQSGSAAKAKRGGPKRSWSDVAFNVWGILVMLFLFLPIIVIVVHSFNTGRLLAVWDGFGPHGVDYRMLNKSYADEGGVKEAKRRYSPAPMIAAARARATLPRRSARPYPG